MDKIRSICDTSIRFILLATILNSSRIVTKGLQSPCPSIFKYIYDGNEWYGQITISPPPVEVITLNVTMSIGVILPTTYVGKLQLLGPRSEILDALVQRRPLTYKLDFPLPSPIPSVTSIRLNGIIICRGPPVKGRLVTTLSLEHTLTAPRIPTSSGNIFTNILTGNSIEHFPESDNNNIYNYIPRIDLTPTNRAQNIPSLDLSINNPSNFNTNDEFAFPEILLFQGIPSRMTSNRDQLATTLSIQPVTSTTPKSVIRPVNRENTNGHNFEPINDDDTAQICGISETVNPLVAKGTHTRRGEFPWLVAIFVQLSLGLEFRCAGSLISHRHVLTVAHCIQYGQNPKVNADDLIILLGKHNIRKWTQDKNSLVIEAQEITMHPDFNADGLGFDSDIAVITLAERILYTRYIRPICLWTAIEDLTIVHNRRGIVAGWGRDEKGNRITSEPRQAWLPIVSQEECLRSDQKFSIFTSNRTFCAGERNGIGPCNGDSGAGFILPQNNRWILRGIVSVSLVDKDTLSCDLNQYIVFTDVAKYKNWLQKFIGSD